MLFKLFQYNHKTELDVMNDRARKDPAKYGFHTIGKSENVEDALLKLCSE